MIHFTKLTLFLAALNIIGLKCSDLPSNSMHLEQLSDSFNSKVSIDETSKPKQSAESALLNIELALLDSIKWNDKYILKENLEILKSFNQDKGGLIINSFELILYAMNNGINYDLLSLLLVGLADNVINQRDKYGSSLLFFAKTPQQAAALLHHGCNLSIKNSFGRDAIDEHIRMNRPGVAQFLMFNPEWKGLNLEDVFNYGL